MIRESVDNLHHHLIYPILVSGDAQRNQEIAHDRILILLQQLEKRPLLRRTLNQVFTYHDPRLQTELAGLTFESPLGIAAGFDKNGEIPNALNSLGFSHVEIGTVTPKPQMGTAQPRVFALPEDGAMINRMGFPSEGMDFVFEKLSYDHPDNGKIWGISIGANLDSVAKSKAIDDYTNAASRLIGCTHYITLNISSPNTKGLRNLQDKRTLTELLDEVNGIIDGRRQVIRFFTQIGRQKAVSIEEIRRTPLFIKIAPDLTFKQVKQILDVSTGKIAGIIATNSTTDSSLRDKLKNDYKGEEGGISGTPLTRKALEMSRFIYEQTDGKLPIIRSGGVMTPQDYWDALTYGGASLVQLYTAFTDKKTSTPNLAYYMNRSVALKMKALGIKNLQSVRGMKKNEVLEWAVK